MLGNARAERNDAGDVGGVSRLRDAAENGFGNRGGVETALAEKVSGDARAEIRRRKSGEFAAQSGERAARGGENVDCGRQKI